MNRETSAGGEQEWVTELAVFFGLTDTRAVVETRTPGTKATRGGARDALEPLDTFQAATIRSAVGSDTSSWTDLIASMRRRRCEVPLESLRSMTGCDCCVWPSWWCPTVNSNGSIKRRTCLRSMWCMETQTGQARIHVGARQEPLNSLDSFKQHL